MTRKSCQHKDSKRSGEKLNVRKTACNFDKYISCTIILNLIYRYTIYHCFTKICYPKTTYFYVYLLVHRANCEFQDIMS